MRTTIRTTIIGFIAACGLAAATVPAVAHAAPGLPCGVLDDCHNAPR